MIFPRKMPAKASGVKFSPVLTPGDVIGRHDSAENGGKCRTPTAALLLKLRELLVVHGAVRGPEIDGAFGDLLDAAAGTDRLVVDLHVLRFLWYSLNHF